MHKSSIDYLKINLNPKKKLKIIKQQNLKNSKEKR